MQRFLDLAVSAVLLAGLYATMAYGLGLIYGVLRLVNLAHAGVIMAGAYLGWILHRELGIDPYLSIPLVLAASFAFGVAVYRGLVRHLPRGAAGGPQSLLLLFGVWLVLRNVAYLLFTGNDRVIRTSYSTRSLGVLGGSVSMNRVAVFAVAVLAGLLSATLFSFNPAFGAGELLKSFVVVVLGGLGSIVGTGLAALVLAVVEVFAILVLPSYLTAAVGFVMLVLVLVLRPGGLFGQRVLG